VRRVQLLRSGERGRSFIKFISGIQFLKSEFLYESLYLSATITQRKTFEMFLKNQFFFFRVYFKIMDRMNCIIFTWNPKLEYFEMSRSLSTKIISHALIVFQFMCLCAATYVFLIIKMKGLSTVSLAFHLLAITATCYLLLFRCVYITKSKELVCFLNIAILLEKRVFSSKFAHSFYTT